MRGTSQASLVVQGAQSRGPLSPGPETYPEAQRGSCELSHTSRGSWAERWFWVSSQGASWGPQRALGWGRAGPAGPGSPRKVLQAPAPTSCPPELQPARSRAGETLQVQEGQPLGAELGTPAKNWSDSDSQMAVMGCKSAERNGVL